MSLETYVRRGLKDEGIASWATQSLRAGAPGGSGAGVTESFDAGHACSGHGRGMCQWGRQRSALQGQLWNWIENHYYNDNGNPGGLRSAFVPSPLDIADAFPDPPVVSAGDTFVANYSTVNYAELPHNQVLLVATLYSANTGYISDPANDAEVVLNPGSNDVARWFTVPDSTPPGGYDLLVALWIDVDEDFAITGADLPLVSYTFPGAVTVQ